MESSFEDIARIYSLEMELNKLKLGVKDEALKCEKEIYLKCLDMLHFFVQENRDNLMALAAMKVWLEEQIYDH